MLLAATLVCCVHAHLPAQWLETGGPFGGSVVALTADTQYVYAGTTQGHIWRRPLSDFLTGIRTPVVQQAPAEGVALTTYPNPCNASTVFTFSLPHPSRVCLLLYDVLGRNVMTVVDRRLEAGSYNFPAQLTSLSSGAYIAVLNAGDIRVASRVLLLR